MALRENYKDDILDTSQNVKRKYQMENNGDGTVSFTDVTEYTQQGDSFGSGDINATNIKVNTIDSAVTTLNANLDGFKFYPTGTGIVGLIADDSAYTDANGKYVIWGTATANQLVADNPNTYKSVPSTEDTRGRVGADSASPFKKSEIFSTLSTPVTGSFIAPKDFEQLILITTIDSSTPYYIQHNGIQYPWIISSFSILRYVLIPNVKKDDVVSMVNAPSFRFMYFY